MKRLMGDVKFDLCMVIFVRLLVAAFLERLKDYEGNDENIKIILSTVVAQYDSVDEYIQKYVLPLGVEAETNAIPIAARQLGMFMKIVQLDGNNWECPEYCYPAEDYRSPMGLSICLLFR